MGEARTRLGERVRHLGRHSGKHGSCDEAVSFESAHGECQHALGDAVYGALQLSESSIARGEFHDDKNRPGVADTIQNVSDAAVRVI
jgi:hypothetical protein